VGCGSYDSRKNQRSAATERARHLTANLWNARTGRTIAMVSASAPTARLNHARFAYATGEMCVCSHEVELINIKRVVTHCCDNTDVTSPLLRLTIRPRYELGNTFSIKQGDSAAEFHP
jgi:hypothetical protein